MINNLNPLVDVAFEDEAELSGHGKVNISIASLTLTCRAEPSNVLPGRAGCEEPASPPSDRPRNPEPPARSPPEPLPRPARQTRPALKLSYRQSSSTLRWCPFPGFARLQV